MPVYAYKGVDGRGKSVTGTRDADSPKSLRAIMRRDGVIVTDVGEARGGAAKRSVPGAKRSINREVNLSLVWIKKTEIAAFTRQLATLLKAGIPLTEGLGALFEQIENPKLKVMVGEIRVQVNEGKALADAMSKHQRTFGEIFISMVRAGETAGNLDVVLLRLADYLENQGKLRSKIIGAMVYPLLMALVGFAVMMILMVAVIPQLTSIYADTDRTLPWNTRLLIAVSKPFAENIVLSLLAMVIGIPLMIWGFIVWKRTPGGRRAWDTLKLKLPLVGSLTKQIAVARFARTLGTLLGSGVPLLRALDVSKESLGNAILAKAIADARERIQQGESIAVTLKRSGHFPPVVTHMIAVGERAGQLEGMLANVADAYDQEVEGRLSRLTTLLEPIMIIIMGGAVAFIVFSILMPIMDINPGM
jgi:general secretion pathway protein F